MLKSAYWPWRRCHFTGFSIFSSCGHFVQQSGTIWAMFLQGTFLRNYFKIGQLALEEMSFYEFSIFSSGGHFVQRSGTILAILVEGHPKNISTKLCWNQPIGLGGDVILRVFFLFLALAATLFSRVEQFQQCFSKEHFCEIILKSAYWPWRRCRFMSFLFLALVAILFSGAEPFYQFLISCIKGSFVWNYFEMGPLA